MWLSKAIKNSKVEDKIECGSVTLSGKETLETASSVNIRSIGAYSPYGYSSLPPVGEEVMLVPSAEGQAIVGTRLNISNIETGEIQISSKGGATIILKNDGSVVINSLTIDKEGKIVE